MATARPVIDRERPVASRIYRVTMFQSWFRTAVLWMSVAVLAACYIKGPAKLLPILAVGGALYTMFHVARGFASARRD